MRDGEMLEMRLYRARRCRTFAAAQLERKETARRPARAGVPARLSVVDRARHRTGTDRSGRGERAMNRVTGNVGVCVILQNKPGEYRTEPVGELTPIETWDYFYCGRHLATFVVATLHGAARIKVIDETESPN